jgi:hypothetical protein
MSITSCNYSAEEPCDLDKAYKYIEQLDSIDIYRRNSAHVYLFRFHYSNNKYESGFIDTNKFHEIDIFFKDCILKIGDSTKCTNLKKGMERVKIFSKTGLYEIRYLNSFTSELVCHNKIKYYYFSDTTLVNKDIFVRVANKSKIYESKLDLPHGHKE